MKKNHRFKIGDVFQIALPNGKYAYGRIYKDASVGIYRQLTSEPNQPPIGSRDFLFHVGLYRPILSSGEWPIIAHDKFESSESKWPPPYYIKDEISGEYEIYHQGEIRKSSAKECKGLERAAVWGSSHVINRIMEELG